MGKKTLDGVGERERERRLVLRLHSVGDGSRHQGRCSFLLIFVSFDCIFQEACYVARSIYKKFKVGDHR